MSSGSKAPTGLSLSRSGGTFTAKWTKGATYEKQKWNRYKNTTGWWDSAHEINKAATSATFDFSFSNYYPYKQQFLTKVAFRVAGKEKKKSYSSATKLVVNIGFPAAPTISNSPSDNADNQTTFSWSAADQEWAPAVGVYLQTQLTAWNAMPDWNVPLEFVGLSGSRTITETLPDYPVVRWVRVAAAGPRGLSGWVQSYRVYSTPYAANSLSGWARTQGNGYQVGVAWNQPYDFCHPVSSVELQYAIAVPTASLGCPAGTSWSSLGTQAGAQTSSPGFVPDLLDEDEALFVRVKTTWLRDPFYSLSSECRLATAFLKAPTLVSVSQNDETYRATVKATNNSAVPGSFLVVSYRTQSKPDNILDVGIIPAGEDTVTVQCPDWSMEDAIEFGVRAVKGTYSSTTRADGVTSYAIYPQMSSNGRVWRGGTVPHAPTNVVVTALDQQGTVKIRWDWSWKEANSAVISWADHEDAWQSTDEPEEYTVSNLNASEWNIAGLEVGKTWYFRVKLVKGSGDNAVSGSWSKLATIDLSVAPSRPVLNLSNRVITVDGSVSATWSYVSGDGTGQAFAELCVATISDGVITYGDVIATTETAQSVTLYAEELGWTVGSTKFLAVRVVSASGKRSAEWSDLVSIQVAEPLTATISQTSLSSGELTEFPFTVTVTGAGDGGVTTLAIERAMAYQMIQPDETSFNGFEGETVYRFSQIGDAQISIAADDQNLVGRLDDGAPYKLIATVQDDLGQTAKAELEFSVNWDHKAELPSGSVIFDDTVAVISIDEAGEGYEVGDVCDIYRLSADRPELIYRGAEFGSVYVDPYPTIGEFGGYRLVYRTNNNDCVTDQKTIAWTDIEAGLNVIYSLIDFEEGQIAFLYDAKQSNSWEKDFKETRYLGGSVVGDWNKGVSRNASLSGSVVTAVDQESMRLFRRLADSPTLCHIRTVDGSSFACDIQVSEERRYDQETIRGTYSLSITRVDPEDPEGVTYEEWYEIPEEESE